MRFSRRLVLMMICLITILLLVSACGGNTTSTASPQPTQTSQPTQPAKTSQPTEPAKTSAAPTATATATPSAIQPQKGGVLKIHRPAAPDTPIGNMGSRSPQTWESMAFIVFQPLAYYDASGKFLPCLATAIKASSDMTYIDVTLREGVKFHDGSEFNAEVLKWNMDDYLVQSGGKSPQWKSIEVLDPYKVRVNLNFWTNTVYNGLAGQMVASKQSYDTKGKDWAYENPMGTGPFKFKDYERSVKMTFTRFDDYWEEGKPYLDGIENIYLTDAMTAQMGFEAGEFDVCYLFTGKQASEIKDEGFPYNPLGSALCPVHALVPSSAEPDSPLSNINVRQAVYLAIDRKGIADAIGYGMLTPINQIAPFGCVAHVDAFDSDKSYDVAQAKQLMKDAGFADGFKTRIIMPPNWANPELASALQSQLAAINIKAEIEFPEQGKFSEYRFTTGGWDEGLVFQEFSNWTVWTIHPSLYWWRAGTMPQYYDMAYPAGLNELVEKLLKTVDIQEDLAQEFSKMLFEDKTVIPIYQLNMVAFLQPGVHCNYMSFAFKNDFLPADAWKEKK